MKYVPPFGYPDETPYVDIDIQQGIEGSPVPAAAIEHTQREIVNVITEAGLTPDKANLRQLTLAIQALILKAIPKAPEKYDLCEFYSFRHPTLRPGFQPAHGGLLENAATLYPEAWGYLKTVEGQKLCKTEADWQAMTTATWATLADGSKVGWNGIGGAPFYAPNLATGALRLPDIRGMYAEAAGFDSLGVGGAHGDAIRNIAAEGAMQNQYGVNSGALVGGGAITVSAGTITTGSMVRFDSSRVVPTAAKNQPRAWGALACVYLGLPAS